MIIQRLQSENLFCFNRLDLHDLPMEGVILLTGPGDSGKSAILEILCCALYGRTAHLARNTLTRAIRWGAERAWVTLDFQTVDQSHYTLHRTLDTQGSHQVTLTRAGADQPMAIGAESVDQAMIQLLGGDFAWAIDSWYLARSRHAKPFASVAPVSGETALAQIAAMLHAETTRLDGQIAELTRAQQACQEEIVSLGVRDDLLNRLEADHDRAQDQLARAHAICARWTGLEEALRQAAQRIDKAATRITTLTASAPLTAWRQATSALKQALGEMEGAFATEHLANQGAPTTHVSSWLGRLHTRLAALEAVLQQMDAERNRLLVWLGEEPAADSSTSTLATQRILLEQSRHQAQQKRIRQGRRAQLFALLIPIFWFASGILWNQVLQARFAPLLTGLLNQHLPGMVLTSTLVMMTVTALPLLLLLCALTGRWRSGARLRSLERQAAGLDQQVITAWQIIDTVPQTGGLSLSDQVNTLETLDALPQALEMRSWMRDTGLPLLDETLWSQECHQLQEALLACQEQVQAVYGLLQVQQQQAASEPVRLGQITWRTAQEVAHEQGRRRTRSRLRATIMALSQEKAAVQQQVVVRQEARAVLDQACQELHGVFLQEMGRIMGLLVSGPGRPQVAVDGTITLVRATDSAVLSMAELSSGLRHKLALAVRMALCLAWEARFPGQRYVMLMDAPFTLLDRRAAQEMLALLQGFGRGGTQIWLTAKELDSALPAPARHVDCLTFRALPT
ncbi:MAG: AAA family ATPase [Magnetococcales bacterium]|nr:AAA family ATPase [Magnetococcales bacterium]NGZ05919.1 AAA family ATPase [Magnetococcales bacterium]